MVSYVSLLYFESYGLGVGVGVGAGVGVGFCLLIGTVIY